jgi:hypothetical protein
MNARLILLILFSYISAFSITNRADYDLKVRLDDKAKTISGYADIVYKNNSPDTLKQINFHLYANLFKNDSDYMKKKNRPDEAKEGYTVIDSMFEDSIKNDEIKINGSMAYLTLKEPISPYQEKKLRVYFTNKIPYPYLREGFYKGKYDISQWYPKVAVYKDKKWSDFQTDDKGEFYNEFGDYSLTITLPENYFVFGTGVMDDDSFELDRIKNISDRDSKQKKDKFKPSDKMKSLRFTAQNVNDYAFSIVNDFKYLKEERGGLTVEIICSRGNEERFKAQIDNVFNIINYFSEKYYPYPYPKITIIEGLLKAGGGMEYPMFIVLGDILAGEKIPDGIIKTQFIEDVIAHEIAHQWFYLISGSDEFNEPFMDEGFATFSEISYMEDKHGSDNYVSIFKKEFFNLFDSHYIAYLNLQTNKKGMAMASKSTDAENQMEYINFYSKGYLVIRCVKDMLSDSVFDKAMKEYFQKFAFSHPSVNDFENHINMFTQDAYSDEIKKLLYENTFSDYSVQFKKLNKRGGVIVIKNKSMTDLPVKVNVRYSDNTEENFTKKVDFDSIYIDRTDIKNITVDKEMKYMDVYYHDNSLHPGLKMHFLPQKPDYFKNNLYVLPAIDYTLYDKMSYGVAVYFCDVLKIEGPFSLGKSNYGADMKIAYNKIMNYPIVKLNIYSEQGDAVRTGTQLNFTASKTYIRIVPSIYAYQYEEADNYKITISYMSRTSLDSSAYYSSRLTEGNVRGLEVKINGMTKASVFNLKYNLFSFLYDPLFYSDIQSAKLDFTLRAVYPAKFVDLGVTLRSGFIYRGRNIETSFYLYRDKFALFDSYRKSISSYDIDMLYQNSGFGFVSADTVSYKAINKVRLSAGKTLSGYADFILAGNIKDGRKLVQAGLTLNFEDAVIFEMPFYNTEYGFMLKDRFTVLMSINLLKVM